MTRRYMAGRRGLPLTLAIFYLATTSAALNAAPYASNVAVTGGTTVNFILNEPADALTYSINGGAAVALDGTTKGLKTFTLGASTDSFSISAEKNAAVGYTIPTGNVLPAGNTPTNTNGFTQPSNESGLSIISDDVTNTLVRFLSPRGLDVNRNPNTANFGTSYIANSAAGPTTIPAGVQRTVGDGLYAIRADQSDAFGYGDTAQNPTNEVDSLPAFVTSPSSPYRIFVKDDGDLYVADYSDANGQLFKITPNLLTARNIFEGFGGPAPVGTTPDGTGLPAGQNHGSFSSSHVEGAFGTADFKVWAMDEDINTAHFSPGGIQNDRNSLWRWDVGATTPSNVTPTKIAGGLIGDFPAGGINVDMTRGPDGKFYMTQLRSTTVTALNPGLLVCDAAGTILFNSLDATRVILNDPGARDILSNVGGVAISPDQQWMALMVNSSDVAVIPLISGIPDLANRLMVDSGAPTGENTGRDIAFDAAGNIHYVSSGQQRYRVLAPGGHTLSTLSYNGTTYEFEIDEVGGADVDLDDDGDIDGNDLLLIQRGLGTTTTGADITAWQTAFGTPAVPAVGAVPEPSTWALAAMVFAACLTMAAPRRRAQLARVNVGR